MKGKILVLLSCILFTSFTLISSAEAAANISTSYGSDGIMTINASYDAECTTSGPHLIIMSNYLQIFSGDTFGVSITEDLSAQHEGTRRYTAYGVGGHLVTNQNGDTVCVPEQNTAITDAAFQNENIVSYPPLDLVRGITTISADYYFTNFNGSTYSSAFLYLNSTLLKSISPAGQSGTISQAVDFSNKKGFQLIKVAACRQTWCNYVEKLVYVEPEDSCPLSVGKPVNAASGNVYLNETDFTIKGTEPIKFTRYYDSAETIARDFGAGWGHTYATRVIGVTGSFHTYKVINPDGSTVYYIDNDGDKVYNVEFPKGEKSRLIRKSDNTFVREFFDGGKEEFNSSGHLTALVDRNGNRITLTRGANNTLIRITDSSVRVITVTNDTSNTKITSITLPDGKVISYAYLTSGLLGSTTYPDGSQKNYEYVNVTGVGYRLTGIKDENNHYTEKHTYDNKGRAITSSSDGTNEKLIINYASDTQSTVTDSLGRVTTYTIDKTLGQSHPTNISGPGCKECGQGNSSKTYDSNLNVTSMTDANGNVTIMTYDASGNMLTRTEAYGTVAERTTTYTYNQFGEMLTETDSDGIITSYTYDATGNILTKTEAYGTTDERTIAYSYNAYGQVLTTTDPNGNTTTNTYDQYGNLASVTNALNQAIIYAYDIMGNLISMTDANGNTTNYEYDLRDRLTRETKPDGGVINYEYDAAGNRTAVTDADGNSTTFTYDSINRLIKTTDPEGDTTNYTFDTENNMASMIIKDNLNNIIISESYSYDDHNRLTRTTHADGTYTEQSYDALGNVLTKRDENGNATTNAYDALNRLISVTDPDSGVTSYTYDKRNNLTSITDANGNVTTYHYDNLNRLISTTSPDTGTTTYTYDTHGNMITKTDANGVTTTYSYDSLDRQTAIQFPDSTQNVTYAFDNCLNGKGRVCMMTDPSGIAWYDYDKMGRVVKESKEINSINYQTDYSYDFNGNVSTITYPGGREIAYTYNQLNKIVSVAETYLGVTRTVVSNIDYQPFGDITSMSYGNGIVTLKTYDNTNRLNSLNVGTLKQLSYVRDNTGNITAITDGLNPVKKRSFTYDLLNRLTFAAGPWGALTYAYDPVGNRTYETTGTGNTTYSYTANKLTAAAGEKVLNFNYDNNGNTTAENNKQYSYNQNQRLTQVTDTSTVLGEYGYNAKSQRIKKSVNGQTTIFHYDQNGLLIAESTVTGEMIAEYVYLNGQPLARMGSGIFSDADGDGVGDAYDNCIEAANPDQRDTNSHEDDNTSLPGIQHYGNICDPDFDNNGFVNILDFNGWRKWARSSAPPAPADIDVDGNGTVWIGDFNIWRRYYGKAPGPGRDSTESNRIYYYHNDHLGTPMMMTDGSGSTVWQGEFKPLGEPVSISGSITNNLRFPGQYYDVETGLHQNWHRDYMPEVGRYVESDPILQPMIDFDVVPNSSSCSQSKQTWQVPNLLSTPQGLQPYVYTANNPINFVDPSGLWTIPGTNWCGPGGSGHLTGCYDKACKAHDKCYEKCALDAKSRWKDGNIFSKCAWECDKKLVKRWKNCACSGASGNW